MPRATVAGGHLLLPSPRERSEWRGGVGGGGRRLLRASGFFAFTRMSKRSPPTPRSQLRCVARPSPPTGGRVATASHCPPDIASLHAIAMRLAAPLSYAAKQSFASAEEIVARPENRRRSLRARRVARPCP